MRRSVKDLAKSFFKGQHTLYCSCDSALPDEEVSVQAYFQPRERDTNTYEKVEIESVTHKDLGNVWERLAPDEIEEFAEELHARFHSYCEAYYEGDG